MLFVHLLLSPIFTPRIVQHDNRHGEDHINLQRAVKRAIDPKNIMNPGKIFILPRVPGGCCDAPAIYHQTETTDGGDKTYEHK